MINGHHTTLGLGEIWCVPLYQLLSAAIKHPNSQYDMRWEFQFNSGR